jgi:hypothetical protein
MLTMPMHGGRFKLVDAILNPRESDSHLNVRFIGETEFTALDKRFFEIDGRRLTVTEVPHAYVQPFFNMGINS